MKQSVQLGKFKRIPIGIHYTWLIVFVLITVSLVYSYGVEYPDWTPMTKLVIGVITSLLFFLSVIGHELAHSLVAIAKGIPVRSITLFVFGGISQMAHEASTAWAEFQIAVAGPASSLLIAGLFWLLAPLTDLISNPLAESFRLLSFLNFMLALFNLLPGFPLDGGRVLRSIIWRLKNNYHAATRISASVGKLIAYGFILLGVWLIINQVWSGLWIAFIGWFLLNAAQANVMQLTLRDAFAGVVAEDVMSRECPTVSRSVPLSEFVNDYLLRTGRRCYLVTEGQHVFGLITPREVSAIPRNEWKTTSVTAAMTPLERLKWVGPNDSALYAMEKMNSENVNQLPVIDNGRLLGIISRETMLNRIQLHASLLERG